MIKQIITCDITGNELSNKDLERMTIVSVVYREVGTVKPFNPRDKPIEAIKDIQKYEFHICAKKAPLFMKKLQTILKELKEK